MWIEQNIKFVLLSFEHALLLIYIKLLLINFIFITRTLQVIAL